MRSRALREACTRDRPARRTAISTTLVRSPWLYRHCPSSSHFLRADRLVDEAQAAGDARLICELFGLTFKAKPDKLFTVLRYGLRPETVER
ncbi:hypothetical protein ABT040_16210 [Streptomyces sp. NPDC002688]|uniref:hypothetical protein n=1 Tax=Streptomyces sp. NPDC002688 TaxID=3154423 RepID=UPI00331D1E72